jgi:Ti-type conjugative transfer relaxase TraA
MVAASAYIGRRRLKNSVTGRTHDFRRGRSEVLHRTVLLPEGADEAFRQPGRLWSAAERAELVFDRKKKMWRFREGAELGRRLIVALPKEFALSENIRLIEQFVDEEFVSKGVPAEIAIHPPEWDGSSNIHAHVLIASRPLNGHEFGKRATNTQPAFAGREDETGFIAEKSKWPQRWAAFQQRFAIEHGIPLTIDPISVVPGVHIGPCGAKATERQVQNNAIDAEEQRKLRDPAYLLSRVAERSAIFGIHDLRRALRKGGIIGMEARKIIQEALLLDDVIALDAPSQLAKPDRHDAMKRSDHRRFTTRTILEQEQRIRANIRKLTLEWGRIRRLPPDALVTAERLIVERGLDREQADAVRFCLQSDGIATIQGKAGTGKSTAAGPVRDALEMAHYKVIGAAPTNAVAGNMRKDGFKTAKTLHRLLKEIEEGALKLDSITVLMVDESAMSDVAIYDRLLEAAAQSGCHLVLIGDDKQLPPVGRGGAYGLIKRELGNVELKEVRRQKLAWMRDASVQLSDWNIGPAIQAYNRHGHITWTDHLQSATRRLVADWGKAADEHPEKTVFVYAGTNRAVDDLNGRLQARRWHNLDTPGQDFECCRGKVEVRVGERLQFHANDLKAGLYNGTLATVTAIGKAGIKVRCDDGTETGFDPRSFAEWGLGYAGTCYRGQGKTQDRAFLLYDHPFVWNAATTYVGLTRHREHVQLYVPKELAADEATLIRQMSRTIEQVLASDLLPASHQDARNDIIKALHPVQEPVMLTFGPTDDRLRGDLNLETTRLALIRHFKTAPAEQFVSDYQALASLAGPSGTAKDGAPSQAELLRRQAAEIAWRRGFRPATGAPDRTCLRYQLLPSEMEDHHIDARFTGNTEEIDVQPLAFQPSLVNYRPFMKMARRLRQLDAFVLDAILKRVQSLRHRLKSDLTISGVLGLANYLVNTSRAIVYGFSDEVGGDWRALRREEGAPRLVWTPLRFHRSGDKEWPVHLIRMSGRALARLHESLGTMHADSTGTINPESSSATRIPAARDGHRLSNRPDEKPGTSSSSSPHLRLP